MHLVRFAAQREHRGILNVSETVFAGSRCVLGRRRSVAEGRPRSGLRLRVLVFQIDPYVGNHCIGR
jgi:hypothetical protein